MKSSFKASAVVDTGQAQNKMRDFFPQQDEYFRAFIQPNMGP